MAAPQTSDSAWEGAPEGALVADYRLSAFAFAAEFAPIVHAWASAFETAEGRNVNAGPAVPDLSIKAIFILGLEFHPASHFNLSTLQNACINNCMYIVI
jgi:hypothetical protein